MAILSVALILAVATAASGQSSSCDVFVRHGLLNHFRQVTGSFDETRVRQAVQEAYERAVQTGTAASGGVSIGPFGGSGRYTRQELEAIRRFFASSFDQSSVARQNAETVSAYIPPEAYDAAKTCWRLESERGLKMDLTWDEEELDEFTIALRFVAQPGITTPVEARGIDFDESAGIRCTGALLTVAQLDNVAKDVTCRRDRVAPAITTNAEGRAVRARSSLVVVRTGAGSIPVRMPEIPAAPNPADPLPVGTIIDWYMAPNTVIPYGYQICNGDAITDAASPLVGQRTPNLIDKFLMGVPPERVGETGGRSDLPPAGAHDHGGAATSLAYRPGEINWDRGPGRSDEFSHGHRIRSDGEHNHGGDNRPPYVGVVKLMKIVPSAAVIASDSRQ